MASLHVGAELLSSFDINNIKIETLLFQTGYLSIDTMIENRRGGFSYTLKVPNKEVNLSLNDLFIDYLTNQNVEKLPYQNSLYDYFFDADLEGIKQTFTSLFASIPYNNYVKNEMAHFEGYYASVMYAYLASLGFELVAEDVTNRGRIDLTLKIENYIYIIEFKVGKENALKQIKEKNYAQKYLSSKSVIYLIGINFDESIKNISLFEYELITV